MLDFNGSGTGAVTLDLQAQTVTEAGFAANMYSGIETININAGGLGFSVLGTANDDTIDVTPYGANAGTLQANAQAPLVNYSNVSGNTVSVDPLGGQDQLIVNATAAADTITLNLTSGSVNTGANGGIVALSLADTEALSVNGLAGDDIFNVTPGTIPVSLDGGDPVAASDVVNLIVPAGAGTVTFNPGPLADEGSFTFSGAGFETVSYDNLEGATVNVSASGGVLVVNGTNADDDISIVGTAANSLTVSVNGGPGVSYSGVTNLTVRGLNGDDDIDVDVNDAALGVVINVDGGLPSTGGDVVTVTGVPGLVNENAM